MISSSEDIDMEKLRPTENQDTTQAVGNLLPLKSRMKYKKAYEQFMSWRNEKKEKSFSESVLLNYFEELSKTFKPSTLWGIYSMLKATINIEHNINIQLFSKLTVFLKRLASGFDSKKSKVLTAENVETFLRDAPDEIYLATKVALIFGINGACRASELVDIKTSDVEDHNDMLLIKLRNTKTQDRSFVIRGQYVDIVKKYQKIRPCKIENNRFFLNYINGKCNKLPMGRHKLADTPKNIAKYLNLPNAENYTGHCFRRTAAILLTNSGADLITLKRHGGWASDNVARGFIEESKKKKRTKDLNKPVNLRPASSNTTSKSSIARSDEYVLPLNPHTPFDNIQTDPLFVETAQNTNIPGKNISLSISNCHNALINFNFK